MHRSLTPEPPGEPGPAREVATLFPDQGCWSEEEYIRLTNSTNRLVEYWDGHIQVLPLPGMTHQLVLQHLALALSRFSSKHEHTTLFAPLRVLLRPGTFRNPDVVFMFAEHEERMGEMFWDGADLVMEVVSDDNRGHDLVTKRADYAAGGIPEHWIVDPRERTITVLTLAGDTYAEHGVFADEHTATSVLLAGSGVEVEAVWKAARR